MSEKTSVVDQPAAQVSTSASPPFLGSPGADIRWLLPIVLCAGVFALALLVTVLLPMRHSVDVEPDPVLQAVLADNVFLLQIRLWTILLMAVLLGGAMAVAGARQNSKALVRLELRLRRIADGESELPPTVPARDFAQFDEVFAGLRSALDRAARQKLPVLQQTHSSLRNLHQLLAAGKTTQDELLKSLSAILRELDIVLDAERRAGRAKTR